MIQGIRSDRVPEELWTEVHNTVQEAVIKTIPKKKKGKMVVWEVLQTVVTECCPLEKGMASHFSIPALRTP